MAATAPILEPLRADPARAAILCDVDGTLAPIVDDPAAAAVPEDARATLAELASRYRLVACISGRRAEHAKRMVGLDQLTYAGNHGLELLEPGRSQPVLDPALGDQAAAAAGFAAGLDPDELARLGLRLEDKGPIQAIHWRGASDGEAAARRAGEIGLKAEQAGLVAHLGRMVLEVRPNVAVDKGVAVRRLLGGGEFATALYGGDDTTDLDAFEALGELEREGLLERGVCVGLASDEGPDEITAGADLVARGTGEFLDLLRSL
jgi:trehalose 6-phosphate phosphatase